MSWTSYFDRIFLINMPHDKKRLTNASTQLARHDIPYLLVEGIYDDDPENGIRQTVINIFKHALNQGLQRILIFEDDFKIVGNLDETMPKVIEQIQPVLPDWYVLYLGVNTHQPFEQFHTENTLEVEQGYGLHAVAYSRIAMQMLLPLFHTDKRPIDVVIAEELQPSGHCLCTYPLLVTQDNGYSNIQRKEMDQSYIVERFYKNVNHLIQF